MADPLDRALEQVARAGRVELAEAQRVEHGDRAGADREDVAQDAAHAGGGALEGLDRARVVVRLDLEGHREAVPDVDHAGVLAGPHQQVRPLRRQQPQQLLRVLVGAVLGPHEREDGQLERIRLAPEARAYPLVLRVGEAELAMSGGGGRLAHAGTIASDSNSRPPSADPVSGSTACSGCGMRPMTLRPALQTPAMSSMAPFGFWPCA